MVLPDLRAEAPWLLLAVDLLSHDAGRARRRGASATDTTARTASSASASSPAQPATPSDEQRASRRRRGVTGCTRLRRWRTSSRGPSSTRGPPPRASDPRATRWQRPAARWRRAAASAPVQRLAAQGQRRFWPRRRCGAGCYAANTYKQLADRSAPRGASTARSEEEAHRSSSHAASSSAARPGAASVHRCSQRAERQKTTTPRLVPGDSASACSDVAAANVPRRLLRRRRRRRRWRWRWRRLRRWERRRLR